MGSRLKPYILEDLKASYPFLITLAAMLLTGLILQIIFSDILGARKEIIPCIFFFSMIPFLIVYNFYLKGKKVSYKDIGITSDKIFKNVIIGLLVGIFSGVIGLILFSVLGVPVDKITGEQAWKFFVLLFLSMCICAPIWEEIATRGLFYTFVEKITRSKLNDKKLVKDSLIVLVVSLFFLLAHYEREPRFLFVIFVTSVIYTVAYHRTRNLIVPIIAHSVYNLLIILRVFI
jgi:membrane protease YdiL (CAAX protease family)